MAIQEHVKMRHPETGGEGTATRKAFDMVWQEKGWELVEEVDPRTGETIEPTSVGDAAPARSRTTRGTAAPDASAAPASPQ